MDGGSKIFPLRHSERGEESPEVWICEKLLRIPRYTERYS